VSQDRLLEDLSPVEAGMVMALWAVLHGERIETTDVAKDCLQYIQHQSLYLVRRYILMQKQGNRSIHKGNIWDLMDICRKYASDTGKLVDWTSANKHMAAVAYNLLTTDLHPYALYKSQSVPVTYSVETNRDIIREALHTTMGSDAYLDMVLDGSSTVAAVVATWSCPVCGNKHHAAVDSTQRIGLRTLWCNHLAYLRTGDPSVTGYSSEDLSRFIVVRRYGDLVLVNYTTRPVRRGVEQLLARMPGNSIGQPR
jgi:hypothetical protein